MHTMNFRSDGFEGYKSRALSRIAALNRGERLPPESNISFESPVEMMRLLSPRRVRILQTLVLLGAQPLTTLASTLGRKRLAVKRDVTILAEATAVLITRRLANGRRETWVEPGADRFNIAGSISGSMTHEDIVHPMPQPELTALS